jgi:hypothetical protein
MRVLVSRTGFGERRGVLRRDKGSAAIQWACFGLYVYPICYCKVLPDSDSGVYSNFSVQKR